MKISTLTFGLCLLVCFPVFAQNTGISDTPHTPAASAVLDVYSKTKGMLVPRMLMTERLAIVSPDTGLMVYQKDGLQGFYYYTGAAWTTFASGTGSQWQSSGSAISYTTGYVGIGLTPALAPLHVRSNGVVTGGICVARFDATQNAGTNNNVNIQVRNNSASSSKTFMLFGGALTNWWAIGNDLYGMNQQNFYICDVNTFTTRFFIGPTGFTGIATETPSSTLHVNGSLSLPVTTRTSNYTATAADHTILCNAGGLTVALPTAVGIAGRIYVIKKTDAAAGTITIDPAGTETIDGAVINTSIVNQYQSITVQSDGANWVILSKN